MKALITAAGTFGPFNTIREGEDRWHCDGCDYPFGVVGDATIGEWVEPDPVPVAEVPKEPTLQEQIDLLTAAVLTGDKTELQARKSKTPFTDFMLP